MSVLDLAQLVLDVTGSRSHITFVARPQDDPRVRQPDITLARRVLGWEPRVDVADGLMRTVDWFGRDGLKLDPAPLGCLERRRSDPGMAHEKDTGRRSRSSSPPGVLSGPSLGHWRVSGLRARLGGRP
jgi:hypothetical protein